VFFFSFETESWTLWAYGSNYVSVDDIEVVTIVSFFDLVLHQEHTLALSLRYKFLTSRHHLFCMLVSRCRWTFCDYTKPHCFQLWDLMHCVVHACCLKSVYWVRWIFLSGINLCQRRQHCCSMYTIHFDINDLCHLTHLTHKHESVLQHMMSSREWLTHNQVVCSSIFLDLQKIYTFVMIHH
jgi:hypothetical protein